MQTPWNHKKAFVKNCSKPVCRCLFLRTYQFWTHLSHFYSITM